MYGVATSLLGKKAVIVKPYYHLPEQLLKQSGTVVAVFQAKDGLMLMLDKSDDGPLVKIPAAHCRVGEYEEEDVDE